METVDLLRKINDHADIARVLACKLDKLNELLWAEKGKVLRAENSAQMAYTAKRLTNIRKEELEKNVFDLIAKNNELKKENEDAHVRHQALEEYLFEKLDDENFFKQMIRRAGEIIEEERIKFNKLNEEHKELKSENRREGEVMGKALVEIAETGYVTFDNVIEIVHRHLKESRRAEKSKEVPSYGWLEGVDH